uniref:Fucose mutarotase n=1 Tax=Equus asinus TaxID=9793 RepID=A0A9L0IDS4_EQUAS
MVVLKGVPALLSPELLFALARMGHGDEIVLADVNFPTSSICRCGPEEIRADGLGIPQLLEAVLKLLPLDTYVESPAAVMELEPSDWERGLQTPVWRSYESILFMAGCTSTLAKIERFEFYERAKKAFAVVATGALPLPLVLKRTWRVRSQTRTHSHREVGLPQAHTCSRALRPGAAPHPQPLHPTFWSDPTLQAPAAHVGLPASGVCPGCCTGTHMHLSGGQSSCARGSLRARPHVSLSQSCGGWWYHHLG